MKPFISIISLAAVSAIALCANPVLAANIERSCKAEYLIHVSVVRNEGGQPVFSVRDVYGTGDRSSFTARRGCGQLVPNRCRRRAGEAALQCMRAHGQNPASAPAACRSNGVRGYHVGNLLQMAKTKACERLNSDGRVYLRNLPRDYTVDITIQGEVRGDKGCGGGDRKKTIIQLKQLRINCNE